MQRLTGRGRATRERIVAAASDLVYERGVARTSTQDVENAAGVSSSQIYHYFADKPALIRAVIAYQGERVVGGQELMLAAGEGMGALEAWRDGVLAMQIRLGPEGGLSGGVTGVGTLRQRSRGPTGSGHRLHAVGVRAVSDPDRNGRAR